MSNLYDLEEKDILYRDIKNLGHLDGNLSSPLRLFGIKFEDLMVEEIEAIARYYSENKPLTFTELIKCDYKVVHLLLLEELESGIEVGYKSLSAMELSEIILEKYGNDEEFREGVKQMFFSKI